MKYEGYEIEFPDGMIIRVPTMEEVIQLRRQFAMERATAKRESSASPKAGRPAVTVPSATAPEGTFQRFAEVIVLPKFQMAHKIVAVVAGNTAGIDRARLMQGTAISTNGALGAHTAGIGRACQLAGITREDIIIKDGGVFRPGPLLLKHAAELPEVPHS